jgi:hypothetical protein
LEFVNTYLPRCTTVSLVSIEKEKEIVYGERERERLFMERVQKKW